MKNNNFIALISFMIFCIYSFTCSADGIKDRFTKRLPAISKMKAEGLIGENNKGYLEARKKLSDEKQKIVDSENSDRKKVYEIFAEKNNLPVEVIGKRRALQIAEKTKPGVWLQKPDGTWYQK